ncbi:MAG: hypothetical protein ACQESR_08185, partial [Planctomycetota bacterium]
AKSSTLQSSTRDKLGTTHLFYFVRFSGFSSAHPVAGLVNSREAEWDSANAQCESVAQLVISLGTPRASTR